MRIDIIFHHRSINIVTDLLQSWLQTPCCWWPRYQISKIQPKLYCWRGCSCQWYDTHLTSDAPHRVAYLLQLIRHRSAHQQERYGRCLHHGAPRPPRKTNPPQVFSESLPLTLDNESGSTVFMPWIGVSRWNGRDTWTWIFFQITSGRINTWKGANQLKELFFLNSIIF